MMMKIRTGQLAAVTVLTSGIACGSALASIDPPVLSMELSVFAKSDTNNPVFDQTIQPTLVGPIGPPENYFWNYSVSEDNPYFSASGTVNASPVTSPISARLNPALTFSNLSGESLWFFVRLSMPVANTFDLPLNFFSSAGFNVAGPDSQLETLEGTPLWTVGVDNTPLGSAFPDPTVLNINNQSVSTDFGGSLTDSVTDSMYIDFAFKLTPDSVGGPSGTFIISQAVPAPGAIALLGFGGLLGRSRRRSAD
jgi:MYXO-CTERM domain-containing protein